MVPYHRQREVREERVETRESRQVYYGNNRGCRIETIRHLHFGTQHALENQPRRLAPSNRSSSNHHSYAARVLAEHVRDWLYDLSIEY
jgi:hypothetical protein